MDPPNPEKNLYKSDKGNRHKLREAIRQKNIDLVQQLIQSGTQLNKLLNMKCRYHTPLHLAVMSRCPEIVKMLLDEGADVNSVNVNGDTPLTLAAKLGDVPIIDLILSHDIHNESNTDCLTHLHIACMRNKVHVVHKLFLAIPSANVSCTIRRDATCWAGYTPLHFAAYYGCVETVDFLLSTGADITAKDANQMTPLHLADLQRNDEVIDLILAAHKYVLTNPSNRQGLSHFHIACTRNNPATIKHFLAFGVDVNIEVRSQPWIGWRPIHFALYYECATVVEILVGANVYLEGFVTDSLLKFYIGSGNGDIYEVISARRSKPVQIHEEYEKLTDFHRACIQNDESAIERLLSLNKLNLPSDFNEPIWTGCSPIHLAVQCRFSGIVQFLLDNGANVMVQDAEGKTPLHTAFQNRNLPIQKIITHNSKDCIQNLIDSTGLSILHILCAMGEVKLIEKLLIQGADVNAAVGLGCMMWAHFTPLHFACKFLQNEVVVLLLEYDASLLVRNILNMTPVDILINGLNHHRCHSSLVKAISKILITILSSERREVRELDLKAMSCLHAMSIFGDKDLAVFHEYLISHQNEIDKLTDLPSSHRFSDFTALHLSMQHHNFGQAKLLLERGADPLKVNGHGETPLQCAASQIRFLNNFSDGDSIFFLQTPIEISNPFHFHLACIVGLTNVVESLLNRATDKTLKMKFINSLTDCKKTPLLSVIARTLNEDSRKNITHLLLENDSSVDARDYRLNTPLHLAVVRGNIDVIRTVISYGANVNAQNIYCQTPLHLIFKSNERRNKKKLILLLENGSDINIVDERGRTSLSGRFRQRSNNDANHNSEDDSEDCYLVLLQHVQKLRALGSYISNLTEEAYTELMAFFSSESFDQATYSQKCEQELKSMMSIKINSSTTLRDILFKSSNSMVSYSSNVVLKTLANSRELFEEFPIYGYLIRLQLKNGESRGPLLMESVESFKVLSRKLMPAVCLEMIFQYLSNIDLKNVIRSAKSSSETE